MIKYIGILLTISLLSSCSYLTDFLLKQDDGIAVDAQIGDTESKVKTGVGKVGYEDSSKLSVTDSKDVAIHNTDDKYHITTTGDAEINVYETNYWLYTIFAAFILGKPALRALWKKRERYNIHEHLASISTLSSSGLDRNGNNGRHSSQNNANRTKI